MQLHHFPFHAMGGPCELQLYAATNDAAELAAKAAIAEVSRIEAKYSRYRDYSVLSKINNAAGGIPVSVDDETAAMLDYAETAYQQ
ncbi:MAG: FAD:protein FMN transferase, partial [Spongiibacteraceae bacterium]